jgi:pimeloyl-ACP methyl ester carboxylesterase
MHRAISFAAAGIVAAVLSIGPSVAAAPAQTISYNYANIDGIKIFYREAGDPKKPTIVLLHGFPTSSHMFRDLIPLLSSRFHLVAPDYVGMGYSEAPSAEKFTATFDSITAVTEKLLEQLGDTKVILYMQDFGGPVGMRVATHHPEWIRGFIVQNTPISEDSWDPARLKAVRASAGPVTPEKRAAAESRVNMQTAILLYQRGARNPAKLNPDAWANVAYSLNNPDSRRIMTDLLLDLPLTLDLYPKWHAYLEKEQPETLVVWGKGDTSTVPAGAEAVKRFVPKAEIHMYDTGHFALEEDAPDIALQIIKKFAK